MFAPKLVGRQSKQANTVVRVGNHCLGAGGVTIIAGPCAVEEREQLIELALQLKEMGVHILRGGVYKPRTSPYDFQGLKETGLRILHEAGQAAGLPVVTEVTDAGIWSRWPNMPTCSRWEAATCITFLY